MKFEPMNPAPPVTRIDDGWNVTDDPPNKWTNSNRKSQQHVMGNLARLPR
jgi:hypothetical protein